MSDAVPLLTSYAGEIIVCAEFEGLEAKDRDTAYDLAVEIGKALCCDSDLASVKIRTIIVDEVYPTEI